MKESTQYSHNIKVVGIVKRLPSGNDPGKYSRKNKRTVLTIVHYCQIC